MIDDQQIHEILMDINQAIESVIDIVQTFIKLYIENKKKGEKHNE